MGNNYRSYAINYLFIIVLNLLSIDSYGQKYSEFAVTGRGDLMLVGDSFKLQKPVYKAFLEMKKAALKEGISIHTVSGYRSYNHQKNIWNRKYSKYISEGMSPIEAIKEITKYSTLPGTSRHHWGTEIDIVDGLVTMPKHILREVNYEPGGIYNRLKSWMDKNSEKYGFYLVYDNSLERKGIKYEPWHYSYMAVSKEMLKDFSKINLEAFFETKKIKGKSHFTKDFLEKYYQLNLLEINAILK